MFLINKEKSLLILIFLCNVLYSQMHIGIKYGKNYDFETAIPKQYLSNGIFDINLIYENYSLLNPFLQIGSTNVPLNYSTVILKNHGDFKTVVLNKVTSFEIGLESRLKSLLYYNFNLKLGIGLSSFKNPTIWLENSNEGIGYVSNYSTSSQTTFAFMDIGSKIERIITKKWKITFDLGTEYFPSDNNLNIETNVNGNNLKINSTFTRFRPYAKIGLLYNIKRTTL